MQLARGCVQLFVFYPGSNFVDNNYVCFFRCCLSANLNEKIMRFSMEPLELVRVASICCHYAEKWSFTKE